MARVLAALAGGVSLLIVRALLGLLTGSIDGSPDARLPFWFDPAPTLATVAFVLVLVVVAAGIAGFIPALQATGRMMNEGIRTSGSRSSARLGWLWTGLVIAQVAFSMAAIPLATEMAWGQLRPGALGPGFRADRFLSARLALDGEADAAGASTEAPGARLTTIQREMLPLLEAEPAVDRVAFGTAVPGEGS